MSFSLNINVIHINDISMLWDHLTHVKSHFGGWWLNTDICSSVICGSISDIDRVVCRHTQKLLVNYYISSYTLQAALIVYSASFIQV